MRLKSSYLRRMVFRDKCKSYLLQIYLQERCMKRFTKKLDNGNYEKLPYARNNDMVNRLGKYEDTGATPAQVNKITRLYAKRLLQIRSVLKDCSDTKKEVKDAAVRICDEYCIYPYKHGAVNDSGNPIQCDTCPMNKFIT